MLTNLDQCLKVKQVKLPFANSNWLDVLYSVRKIWSLLSQAASKPVRQVFCNYMKNGFGLSGVLATSERKKNCLFMLVCVCVHVIEKGGNTDTEEIQKKQ